MDGVAEVYAQHKLRSSAAPEGDRHARCALSSPSYSCALRSSAAPEGDRHPRVRRRLPVRHRVAILGRPEGDRHAD